MNDTPTIRARIHDSAIRRVTRTFAATLADIFTETLQNSRRAGATRVRVAVAGPADTGPLTVTVTDDGAGISDPAVLLSFGENGWSEDLARREDAAGMGMLSLARRGCTVSSRPRNTDGSAPSGWRVELAPEHFLGEAAAEVHPDDGAPWPQGTAVTFQATESESADNIRAATGIAAWHYPLQVVFENDADLAFAESLVLGGRRPAAGHRGQRHRTLAARATRACRVPFRQRRCRRGFVGDPAD